MQIQCKQIKRIGVFLAFLISASVLWALTPAGVIINNQATATYTDSNSVVQSTSSNLVQTLVQEVVGVIVTAPITKAVVENATFNFPHFLTNTGNGPESYTVCLDQNAFEGSDDFSYDSIQLFADADQDGIPDSGTPYSLVSTPTGVTLPPGPNASPCYQIPPLNGGDAIQIVVAAVISDRTPDLTPGEEAQFSITAYADSDVTVTGTNTDTGFYTNEPIIEVVKAISDNQGVSPSGPYTVTLTYRNIGASDAQNLEITEILPTDTFPTPLRGAGMTYVAGSAEWSHDGAASVTLTDTSLVAQTSGTAQAVFCAYDNVCTGGGAPFGSDRAAIQVNSIAAGETGTITFDIDIQSGLFDSDVLRNLVQYKYQNLSAANIPGPTANDTLDSNAVTFVIINAVTAPGVVANSSDSLATVGVDDSLDADNIVSVASIEQGDSTTFDNYIWNTGDGVDSFDITIDDVLNREGNPLSTPFPSGTTYDLFKPDGVSPLLDTNGNGTPDTGPMNSGTSFRVVLRVTPPATLVGDNSGNGWDVTKVATSFSDTNISNAVTDRLLEITESIVDLTNAQIYDTDCLNVSTGAATPGAGGCTDYQGEGYPAGEATPVNTFTVATGATVYIPLWSHNVGAAQDSFDLAFSSTNFSAGVAPAGWTVRFVESTNGTDCSAVGNSVSSTGLISAGNNLLACAEISIDENVIADGVPQSIFFRVLSPTTGKVDIKHDEVLVQQNPILDIIPDHFGQGRPGEFVNYPHQITNLGNTNLECVNVALSDSLAANDWVSLLYQDVNEDAALDAGDIPLADQTLAPGESFRIIVRIFIPTTATEATTNVTTVTANGVVDDNDANPATCTGAAVTDEAKDSTMTTLTDIVIRKSQAPDVDCDGVPDSAYVFTEFQVSPGECVSYLLRSTNTGTQQMVNLVVDDDTPPFTVYLPAAESCSVVGGTPTNCSPPTQAPTAGSSGPISWSITDLEAGGTIDATFGVQVE